MAEWLQQETGVPTKLTPGENGEFTVLFQDKILGQKTPDGFPDDGTLLAALRALMPSS